MGNTGFRKYYFPGDFVENKYNNAYEIDVMDLDRNEIKLNQYKNKLNLIVNVASRNVDSQKQIEDLNELQNLYQAKLSVLAFPSNQFQNEPGNFQEIKEFYYDKMKIKFSLFSKTEVNGEYTSQIYKYLKKNSQFFNLNLVNASPIESDFCKFLLNSNGTVHKFYDKDTSIQQIKKDIDVLLNQ